MWCLISLILFNYFLSSNALIPSRDCNCRLKTTPKIVGGSFVKENHFPWLVSISKTLSDVNQSSEAIVQAHVCGGVLLNEYWVLTAGHCVQEYQDFPDTLSVGFGHDDLIDMYQMDQVLVSEIHIHPVYDRLFTFAFNDLALIKLDYPIQFDSKTLPACLSPHFGRSSDPIIRNRLMTAGFGVTLIENANDEFVYSQKLKQLELFDKSNVKYICQTYKELICTTSYQGNTCYGDSGGPLQVNRNGFTSVIGIATFYMSKHGKPCKGISSFTRIADYMEWIETYVGNQYCSVSI